MFCERCKDTGLWLTPRGKIECCPRLQLNQPHPLPPSNASALQSAVKSLGEKGEPISHMIFETAQIITAFNESNPCPGSLLENHFFAETNLDPLERTKKLNAAIEELRTNWQLRLKTKRGHYWISDQ